MNRVLLDFYRSNGTDNRGRSLDRILARTDEFLEDSHDVIQWLFPLPEPSNYNPDAPLLDPVTQLMFQQDPSIQANLRRSFARFEKFLGIHPALEHKVRPYWLRQGDHNHLRLTRILRCLTLSGLPDLAKDLHGKLLELHATFPGQVSDRTLAFWAAEVP